MSYLLLLNQFKQPALFFFSTSVVLLLSYCTLSHDNQRNGAQTEQQQMGMIIKGVVQHFCAKLLSCKEKVT